MSGRRRSRNRGPRGGNNAAQNQPSGSSGRGQANRSGGKGGPKGGRSSGSGRKRSSGRRNRKPNPAAGAGFWGDPARLPTSHPDIQITDDPAAVPRSLGTPPLPGHEAIAVHYFTAVYDRAVATAGALAAAGGLIDPTSLIDDD
jgi:hypothetical protein